MPRWTIEARLRQAERIRALCPWTRSTGPRTEEGKGRSARNAWKGGHRATAAAYAKVLRNFESTTRRLFSSFCRKRTSPAPNRKSERRPTSEPGLFSSFCQNGVLPPTQPSISPLRPEDWDLPPEPDLEKLSPEALIEMAESLLGGGLLSSFSL